MASLLLALSTGVLSSAVSTRAAHVDNEKRAFAAFQIRTKTRHSAANYWEENMMSAKTPTRVRRGLFQPPRSGITQTWWTQRTSSLGSSRVNVTDFGGCRRWSRSSIYVKTDRFPNVKSEIKMFLKWPPERKVWILTCRPCSPASYLLSPSSCSVAT